MQQLIMIAFGGALGSILRFMTATKIQSMVSNNFPYGILTVNVLGCLLMGFLSALLIDKLMLAPIWRAAILVGFLGGFTTFSSFSIDTLSLFEQGLYLSASLYIVLSLTLCLLATGLGLYLGRIL